YLCGEDPSRETFSPSPGDQNARRAGEDHSHGKRVAQMFHLLLPPSQLMDLIEEDIGLCSRTKLSLHDRVGKPMGNSPESTRDLSENFEGEPHEEDVLCRNL